MSPELSISPETVNEAVLRILREPLAFIFNDFATAETPAGISHVKLAGIITS